MQKNVLVTGGAGYIGSHTCVDLIQNGFTPVVIDNFSNSQETSLARVEELTGQSFPYYNVDVRDGDCVEHLLKQYECAGVVHFAGLKAVGESVEKPLDYYEHNVVGTHLLLKAMQAANVRVFVFSSSATVYGVPETLPLKEDHPLSATNPYGQTKLSIEMMLRDVEQSEPAWRIGVLRYFNPVGAHPSGRIGEDPLGIPNNLVPFIAQVAVGRREKLAVFGDDYDTVDGTGVRDYIHVMDLAEAHTLALKQLISNPANLTVNLGTGRGASVLEVLRAFEKACEKQLDYEVVARRSGDIAACFADATLASDVLGWRAKRSFEDMCRDHWNWQKHNPHGYRQT